MSRPPTPAAGPPGRCAVAPALADPSTRRIGLLGGSQVGWVAPMAAADSHIAFMALVTAESIIDTVASRGVDAREFPGGMTQPGLRPFGAGDNSIPARMSIAVLDPPPAPRPAQPVSAGPAMLRHVATEQSRHRLPPPDGAGPAGDD